MTFDRPILLVEDNEDDVFIFKRVYRQTGLPHPFHVANNSQDALEYLNGSGHGADQPPRPTPFLVLLDLKLPFLSGLDLLDALATQQKLGDLSAVVLTSSAESRDIQRARELGAQAFLVKPPTVKMLTSAVAAAHARLTAATAIGASIDGDRFADFSTG